MSGSGAHVRLDGLICCGATIASAFGLARNVEYVAQLQYRTRCIGRPNVLTDRQMDVVMVRFQSYGQGAPEAEAPA